MIQPVASCRLLLNKALKICSLPACLLNQSSIDTESFMFVGGKNIKSTYFGGLVSTITNLNAKGWDQGNPFHSCFALVQKTLPQQRSFLYKTFISLYRTTFEKGIKKADTFLVQALIKLLHIWALTLHFLNSGRRKHKTCPQKKLHSLYSVSPILTSYVDFQWPIRLKHTYFWSFLAEEHQNSVPSPKPQNSPLQAEIEKSPSVSTTYGDTEQTAMLLQVIISVGLIHFHNSK